MRLQFIPFVIWISLLPIPACKSGSVEPCSFEEPLHSQAPYPVGFAAYVHEFRLNSAYQEHAETHFNRLTPGNVLKMESLHPAEGQFDFNEADLRVDLALAKGFRVHGHTLIWHS